MTDSSNNKRVVAIIQARMGSTRLPGKVLMPVAGRPMLDHLLDRLRRSTMLTNIVVATSVSPQDDGLAAHVDKHPDIAVSRGSENDVLDRYYQAATQANADVVVRITGDCPLIDPAVIDQCIEKYLSADSAFDYVANIVERSYPRGLDTEVFSFQALQTAWRDASQEADREHVTPFIWRQPELFRIGSVVNHEKTDDHRWTVDTQEDYDFVCAVFDALYSKNPAFAYTEIMTLLASQPALRSINAGIAQKPVSFDEGVAAETAQSG